MSAITTQPQTMLRSVKELIGYPIHATDGDVGRCVDFLFDDEHWTIRYLVGDTRRWLSGRKVLICPSRFGMPDLGFGRRRFQVKLTKRAIEDCPPLDWDAPVSRLYEAELARFHNYPPYWIGAGAWGLVPFPPAHAPSVANQMEQAERERHERELRRLERSHLRSVVEVKGYRLAALDGEIGHLEDLVVEAGTWAIRWIVVDTCNWLPGHKAIVSPTWIKAVHFPDPVVSLDVTKEQVRHAPVYDHRIPINRDYEGVLYDYYGRPSHWTLAT